jgi:Tol biopolymer transport system component
VRISRSSVWVCSTAPGAVPYQLTHGPRSDSLPRWSPGSDTIAFLSDRAVVGQSQIYTMAVPDQPRNDLGESTVDDGAQALTDVVGDIPTPRGLNAVQWDPDGRSIAFLLEEQTQSIDREFGDDALEYEEHPAFVRIHRVDIETKTLRVVSPRSVGQIWEFSPGPGGKIAAVVSATPFEWSWYSCRLVSFAGSDGDEDDQSATVRELASPTSDGGGKSPPQSRQVAQPQWSNDGQRIAFVTSTWSDRGCVAGTLMVCNADGSVSVIGLGSTAI